MEWRLGTDVEHTVGLFAEALADPSRVLEVDVPALGLAGSILQRESKDGVALFDGGLALGLVSGEGSVDGVEGLGGGELGCVLTRSAMHFFISSPAMAIAKGG